MVLFIYYDPIHPKWYKKPDWFLVIGIDYLYKKTEFRESYVIWQEEISPLVVIELLSPRTVKEDLGEKASKEDLEKDHSPPDNFLNIPHSKWEVYEQILQAPYYLAFNDITNELRYFKLIHGKYEEQILPEKSPVWIPELNLSLGLWYGDHDYITRT
jgi:Uma2 family endonuclease